MTQVVLSNGRRVKRSTKVPADGGFYQGERLTPAQAKNRAMLVAVKLARAEQSESSREDNLSVSELFDKMLAGRLGRVSQATYNNARTSYRFFCEWLGHRADEPARLIKRADVKQWVLDRRAEVRAKTVQHDLYVVRAAFN